MSAFRTVLVFGVSGLLTGCAINFELTSQRTALENQILGSYEELDDDLLLVSSVRALDESGKKKEITVSSLQVDALRARQNQQFNKDDLDEFKTKQMIGEVADGTLALLPAGRGLVAKAQKKELSLARLLVKEENHDRRIVWRRIIELNENLKASDMPKVRKTYADQIFKKAPAGHWFKRETGNWIQKSAKNTPAH